MQSIKYALSGIILVGALITTGVQPAEATGNKCDIPKLKLGEKAGQNMVAKGDQIFATFKVEGKNCTTPVTLAVWESPSADGQPINEQELYDYTTKTFGPGTHSIATDLPNCFWQADLLVGDEPTAPDGTANYAYQNGEILKVHPLRDFKYGGEGVCEDPEEPENPEEPETPVTPENPTPQVKAVQTPSKLPSTGPAAIATTFFGVSGLAGLAHAIFRRFRG